ncbi:MAG: hypothetical protein KF859_05170 [Phycisphaeraceae bacterium]|nr:hypothetical protein [Phycisphaeraceae bacterium]
MPTLRTAAQAIALAATLVCLGSLPACSHQEVYTYRSVPDWPQTISLVNTATGETVWTCEVPVGQRLDMSFKYRAARANELGYDELTWTLVGTDTIPTGRRSTLRVPPPASRKLVTTLRPIPEPYAHTNK